MPTAASPQAQPREPLTCSLQTTRAAPVPPAPHHATSWRVACAGHITTLCVHTRSAYLVGAKRTHTHGQDVSLHAVTGTARSLQCSAIRSGKAADAVDGYSPPAAKPHSMGLTAGASSPIQLETAHWPRVSMLPSSSCALRASRSARTLLHTRVASPDLSRRRARARAYPPSFPEHAMVPSPSHTAAFDSAASHLRRAATAAGF